MRNGVTISKPELFKKPKLTHKQLWWRWHLRHREVMDQFETKTLELIKLGHKRFSQDAILHHIRYQINSVRLDEREQFKINNNWSAYYARYFIHLYPEFKNFFELRSAGDEKRTKKTNPKTIKLKSHWNR